MNRHLRCPKCLGEWFTADVEDIRGMSGVLLVLVCRACDHEQRINMSIERALEIEREIAIENALELKNDKDAC